MEIEIKFMIIQIALGVFILLEFSNVIALYFYPETQRANAMGIFVAWEKAKSDEETHLLLRYLVNWVAGTKLIFILLTLVILIVGDITTQFLSLIVLVLSILTYYWRLYPLITEMDNKDLLQPSGYSKSLTLMITAIVLVLSTAGFVDYVIL